MPLVQQHWTNKMGNHSLVQWFEVMYESDFAMSKRHSKLRPGQTSFTWTIDLMAKFSCPGDHLMDFFARINAVSKACMLCLSIGVL